MNTYCQFRKKGTLFVFVLFAFISFPQRSFAQYEWLDKETDHFKIIYKTSHSHIADYLLNCAEKSFSMLERIFKYSPAEKIVLNTFDLYDYGFGESTSIPQNYIHIEIEPFEPGYENVPYNERFQWVINHELVHIFYNDQSVKPESAARSIFSKVAPEQIQPMTIPYSVITNYNRYSPMWYQEAIAIYLETFMSGGFGRLLSSFDEMFFRSMVLEKRDFPTLNELESALPNNSFMLDMLSYLYGARFSAFLALKYGNDAFLDWYRNNNSSGYSNYSKRFKKKFGIPLSEAWDNFLANERIFEEGNVVRLNTSPVTKLNYTIQKSFGWVSQPFFDGKDNIYFSYHTKHKLASICRLNLMTGVSEDLYSLPTPSLSQVSSTAFDPVSGFYFFTTNNNQLYRDVIVLDVKSKESKVIFNDERVGNLSVSPVSKTLWGVRHNAGEASIVYSQYPYREFTMLRSFPIGEEVYSLSVSPSGRYLAVVLHKSSGVQQLLLVDLKNLQDIKLVYDIGNPENPSWSPDEKRIYFNSFANGVSNIFRYSVSDGKTLAVTHTLKGLFKPVEINNDKIFAFEFSTEGFVPVFFDVVEVNSLPAINYLGQELFEKNPQVKDYLINISFTDNDTTASKKIYSGLGNLKVQTFIPVISGFQSSAVAGFFTRITDPLLYHDFSLEAGYSFYRKNSSTPKFHLKTKYEYKKEIILGFDYNAPDFYDLFNSRKRGMIGQKYYIGCDNYIVYDNPLKIKHTSEIALYRGVQSFSDNLVPVSQPDFLVAQSSVNSSNLRRSIGSIDYEKGDEFSLSMVLFSSSWKSAELSAQTFGEWNILFNWITPHNIFSIRLSAGYRFENENHFQSKFFFGGFGNRELENADVKQYRKTFMFPGLPIYDLFCDRFLKIGFENVLPPIRFENSDFGNHYLNYLDFSVYTNTLFANSSRSDYWIDFGVQANLVFKHWYNLESTLSAGLAKAFSNNENGWDWFVSLKLLRN